jgi:hypothetical protein
VAAKAVVLFTCDNLECNYTDSVLLADGGMRTVSPVAPPTGWHVAFSVRLGRLAIYCAASKCKLTMMQDGAP